jgi:restriction endonuclease S subunit
MSVVNKKNELNDSPDYNSKYNIMASVESFKSAVVRIRDILRGPGVAITGMDSMRHICLYLLSRYMTKDKVKSLGVPDEFAWETLIETAQTKNGGVQKALDCFFHKETDCLVNHFDRLFGTDNFSFDIKNPTKHKEMLEILDKINMEGVDCQMDILGWVYEQHLKTGSSAARDLGQFFTDRFICEYMTNLCKPGFKSKGVPESVCDPSMGTGGFLTSYMKFYKKYHTDTQVDWSVQNKEIHGCDTDPKVAGVARLNLFMESGGNRAVNLRTHDSLYGDLIQTGYDLILANMPFGLKGIKHAECCERVKDLKIRGTKSEPLFLQLMMVSLNSGGRCAVVVPDGMLVNGSTCHDETRRYLLDNFELRRVIKMKGQFFMNTGIQPSILFFENTGKPTSVVEFWDVIKGVNGVIEETMVLSVPREKFDASCSFDMRRYQEVKAVANPAGFPMVKLGDIIHKTGSGKTNSTSISNTGEYPFYGCTAIVPSGTHASYDFDDTDYLLFAKSGGNAKNPISPSMGIGKFHHVKGRSSGNVAIYQYKIKSEKMNDITYAYLSYILKLNLHKFQILAKYTTGNGNIDINEALNVIIPIPPLEIQQEIVATLDRIYAPCTTELAETLKLTDRVMDIVLANPSGDSLEPIVAAQRLMRKSIQMVADVKAQMVAIMKSMNMRGFEVKKLADVCKVSFGARITQKDDTGTIYPVYGSGCDTFKTDKFNRTGKTCKVGRFAISEVNMVMLVDGPYWLMDSGFTLESKNPEIIMNEYLWYCLLMDKKRLSTISTGSCQKNIEMEGFYKIEYVFPPIDFQLSVLKRMNELESQISYLENLGKQAEDNARFMLDSYLSN